MPDVQIIKLPDLPTGIPEANQFYEQELRALAQAFGVPPEMLQSKLTEIANITTIGIMHLVQSVRAAVNGLVEWYGRWNFEDTAARRKRKQERKARRHAFLSHGKHGLKRPRGHRKVSKRG